MPETTLHTLVRVPNAGVAVTIEEPTGRIGVVDERSGSIVLASLDTMGPLMMALEYAQQYAMARMGVTPMEASDDD